MDVREKLAEIMTNLDCNEEYCKDCKFCNDIDGCAHRQKEIIADRLIANGVTVQEWISVKEHLPQENEPEGKVCEQVQVLLINGAVSTGWCNRLTKMWWHLGYGETKFVGYEYENTPVIAWQPLAQPPKGE